MMRRALRTALLATVPALLLAGCGGDAGSDSPPPASTPASSTAVEPVLVLQGMERTTSGRLSSAEPKLVDEPRRSSIGARDRTSRSATKARTWPAPALASDGTIDDGADPFAGLPLQSLPLPIEDDPETTRAIDAWSTKLRRIDAAEWTRWMGRGGGGDPFTRVPDAVMLHLVEVATMRCGGARTVASGVVLADETVVTTVHAIESPARRVRVQPALGGPRVPAMVRYLDVDDDVAVLHVPGLDMQPMPMHVATGSAPEWARAYGIGTGGQDGQIRRVPVGVAMREAAIDLEQPDGFAETISDRSVIPLVGGIGTGFSGGVVAATDDADQGTGWGFHALVRARVPFRAETAGIAVPARLVAAALAASARLDRWQEHRPGGCPQWYR